MEKDALSTGYPTSRRFASSMLCTSVCLRSGGAILRSRKMFSLSQRQLSKAQCNQIAHGLRAKHKCWVGHVFGHADGGV